jgi:arginine/lysine/ornithine decarboxylase
MGFCRTCRDGNTIAAAVPNTTEQRLLLTNSTWDGEAMNRQRIRQMRDKVCVGNGGVLIFDDTEFPKHSWPSQRQVGNYSLARGAQGLAS